MACKTCDWGGLDVHDADLGERCFECPSCGGLQGTEYPP